MNDKGDELTAILKFKRSEELKAVFINSGNDEEERATRKAVSQLIKPKIFQWITRTLSW